MEEISLANFVKRKSDNPTYPNWFELTREMNSQFAAWREYFERRFGLLPVGMEMLLARRIDTFLVPTEWPRWFDSNFALPA